MIIPGPRPSGEIKRRVPGECGRCVADSAGDRALIFTQFDEMGILLHHHLEESFGRDVLWLRGQVLKAQRDRLVDRPRLFVLSLNAGGTGLNLTAANHVFHFDRWWNPAVENQATDRAFRIVQKSNVQVHKFI
jgi:SNF2 family DNA or RNA helicase